LGADDPKTRDLADAHSWESGEATHLLAFTFIHHFWMPLMFPSDVLAPDLSSHLDALACQCLRESGKVGEQQRKKENMATKKNMSHKRDPGHCCWFSTSPNCGLPLDILFPGQHYFYQRR
jgi:hypothetical protein